MRTYAVVALLATMLVCIHVSVDHAMIGYWVPEANANGEARHFHSHENNGHDHHHPSHGTPTADTSGSEEEDHDPHGHDHHDHFLKARVLSVSFSAGESPSPACLPQPLLPVATESFHRVIPRAHPPPVAETYLSNLSLLL